MATIEVYNNYSSLGIVSRPITYGEEFEMVQQFIDFKKNSFKEQTNKQLAIFIETKINDAYPDVIFAEYDPCKYEKWNVSRKNLSTPDLKLLHYLYVNRDVTSRKIINDLSIQYKTLLHSLEALLDAGLISRSNECWNILDRENLFAVNKIEAVEAKISKWDAVMQQAILNKSFASESFVLSKCKREPNDDIVKRISSFGIGIYLFDDYHFSRVARAKRNRFPSNYNSVYLNECIGKILNA